MQNYNKNRIHSSRGAKEVEIALDGRMIFKGEITQACGNIVATNDPSAYGEVRNLILRNKNYIGMIQTILFTTDDAILEKISSHDEMYVDQETNQDDEDNNRMGTNRPPEEGLDVSLFSDLYLEIKVFDL